MLGRKSVQIPDVLADSEYTVQEAARLGGFRTILVVPLLREGVPIGLLSMQRAAVRPFHEKQIELAETFADQAGIAIENVRLFDEGQARTRELAQSVEELQALGEVSHAVNSTLDLQTVLSTIVAKAAQLSGTEAGAIYVFDETQQLFRLRATYGLSEELVAAIEDQHIGASDAIRQVTQDRQPQEIADIREEPPSPLREIAMRAGYRARLTVPLVGADKPRAAPAAFLIRDRVVVLTMRPLRNYPPESDCNRRFRQCAQGARHGCSRFRQSRSGTLCPAWGYRLSLIRAETGAVAPPLLHAGVR